MMPQVIDPRGRGEEGRLLLLLPPLLLALYKRACNRERHHKVPLRGGVNIVAGE